MNDANEPEKAIKMPTNIRLTDKEQELIRIKAVEINKALVGKGMQPVKDSELIHKILEKSIRYTVLNEKGEITVITP